MHASATPPDGGTGVDLLLQHLTALDRLAEPRPAPFDRLAAELGTDLARLLVDALAGEYGVHMSRRVAA